jgi:hypothetical protein
MPVVVILRTLLRVLPPEGERVDITDLGLASLKLLLERLASFGISSCKVNKWPFATAT